MASHSQNVAIRFRDHDKPRVMGVAIAIDPYPNKNMGEIPSQH